jgi:hypothetical protein
MTMTQVVTGWLKSGCGLPTVARVHNWGCTGCDRWVVVVHFWGHGNTEDYRGEFDSRQEAERAARAINGSLTRIANKVAASLAA